MRVSHWFVWEIRFIQTHLNLAAWVRKARH